MPRLKAVSKHVEVPATHTPEVADLVIRYLEQLGVEYIFGVPGAAIEPLYNALARSERRGSIRHILTRHEAGAASMADGYARESGKIGVCCATSGPGATNLITGVACAYDNAIPMLVLTGQPALPNFGKNALQESSCTGINTLSMFRHCTRYNSLVSHPKQMEAKLVAALQRAVGIPKGPVHLSLPVDVFRSPCPVGEPSYKLGDILNPAPLVDNNAIDTLRGMVASAKKIVLLIGGDCGEAINLILQFAALTNATFVTTPDGKGLVNSRHPLFRGVFGFAGHLRAEMELRDQAVDLIIAIGTNMGEWNSGGWCDSVLNDRLVHIDESPEHLAFSSIARLRVRGHVFSIFKRLNEQLCDKTPEKVQAVTLMEEEKDPNWDSNHFVAEPEKYLSNATPIKPQRLMRELGRMFPPNTHFLADSGNSVAWAVHYLHSGTNRRINERRKVAVQRTIDQGQRKTSAGWLRLTANFASMGWAIGAAVGTATATPDVPVVCITGDGSMLMNGQEISVAVAEKMTVVYVVLNDQSLGMVKHGQRLAGAEAIGFELPPTDFAMLARALGADAYTIHSPADMEALDIDAICSRAGPTLLDVYIDQEEVPPMNIRMKILMNAM